LQEGGKRRRGGGFPLEKQFYSAKKERCVPDVSHFQIEKEKRRGRKETQEKGGGEKEGDRRGPLSVGRCVGGGFTSFCFKREKAKKKRRK